MSTTCMTLLHQGWVRLNRGKVSRACKCIPLAWSGDDRAHVSRGNTYTPICTPATYRQEAMFDPPHQGHHESSLPGAPAPRVVRIRGPDRPSPCHARGRTLNVRFSVIVLSRTLKFREARAWTWGSTSSSAGRELFSGLRSSATGHDAG